MEKQTHVDIPKEFMKAAGKVALNNDNIGYVESYDFSRANMLQESRIAAISTIASVCYQNINALGSISLYNRLATENKGLPSSSYEFVPVLLKAETILNGVTTNPYMSNCLKYGEWIEEHKYLLTNLRALISDVGEDADQFFNTEEECAIIAKHFKVYKSKIDLATARQFMRHRASWQELSRRYVSGKKAELEFYISPKLQGIEITVEDANNEEDHFIIETEDLIQMCLNHYYKALESGVKPEEARRILPQAMYTTVWSAWQPKQLDVLFKLRIDKHAQAEIQELAKGMKILSQPETKICNSSNLTFPKDINENNL